MEKVLLRCPKCHSSKIVADASATWHTASQKFILTGVMDHMSCEDCGHDSDHGFTMISDDQTKTVPNTLTF